MYPEAALHLVYGKVDHESLKLIGHPASKKKEEKYSWAPPECGFVKPGTTEWTIIEGWILEPKSLSNFKFFIDNLSSAMNEVFNSKKLKWVPKCDHFTRFWQNGLWYAAGSRHLPNMAGAL